MRLLRPLLLFVICLALAACTLSLSTPPAPQHAQPATAATVDLRVLDAGPTANTYLIEGASYAQFAVGADLVVYGEPNPGTEVAIALLKVIGQSPNSLTAQALLIDPQNAIRTRMRVDGNLGFLSTSQLMPVFDYAAGYLLRPSSIRLRPDHALAVGAQLQVLEFERINSEIIDALRTDTIMQITDIGVNGQVAVVDLLTGTWPMTGTIVALAEIPTPPPTAIDLPTATAQPEPMATPTPIATNQVRIIVTGIGAAPADVTSPGLKKQYALTAAKAVASANFARWQNGEAVEEVVIVNEAAGELLEDAIRIEVQRARIPGGTVIEQTYDDANGEAEVTVEYVVDLPQ